MPRLRLSWIFGLAFAVALALASNSAAADGLGQSAVAAAGAIEASFIYKPYRG